MSGLTAGEIREGTTSRGLPKGASDKKNRKTLQQNSAKQPTEIRGPICTDSVAAYIQAITARALEKFFNRIVGMLAAARFFPKKVHALLDASAIESTEKCLGCGKVSKEKAPELRLRQGRIRKVLETVFGFKIWVVWDPNSKLPLAMRFATIEVADVTMAKKVVQQAITNLGDHAKIVALAFDKGFIDGVFLWWLNSKGVTFYTPAKKSMHVYTDALSLVESGIRKTREKTRSSGHGKNKRTTTDRWDVEGLTSAGFYGELGRAATNIITILSQIPSTQLWSGTTRTRKTIRIPTPL